MSDPSSEHEARGEEPERTSAAPAGSADMRMEKGRGAAAAGQLLHIRAGRLCEIVTRPLAATFLGTPAPACLCVVLVCLSAPSTVCLHGTGGCASCRDGMNVNV